MNAESEKNEINPRVFLDLLLRTKKYILINIIMTRLIIHNKLHILYYHIQNNLLGV